jgi:uncharacterized membrane protein YcaP (DUF421 family)
MRVAMLVSSRWSEGRSDVIVRDGILDESLARHNRLSEHDLLEDFRLHGNISNAGGARRVSALLLSI